MLFSIDGGQKHKSRVERPASDPKSFASALRRARNFPTMP
jgi:hypothetical protein